MHDHGDAGRGGRETPDDAGLRLMGMNDVRLELTQTMPDMPESRNVPAAASPHGSAPVSREARRLGHG